MYRVDRTALIDERDLLSRITARTKVVYVTHFFGWPQDLTTIAGACRERGIKLLEDCALSLFSRAAGVAGDGAVYSLTKSLAVPDGGVAVWSRSTAVGERHPPGIKRTLRRCLSLVKRDLIRRLGGTNTRGWRPSGVTPEAWVRPNNDGGRRPAMPQSYFFKELDQSAGCSQCTRGAIQRVNEGIVVATRRDNYLALRRDLKGVASLQPLYSSLPEGVCPLVMPVIVDDRSRWVSDLNRAGIDAISWWAGYHPAPACDEFPDAAYLKNHVMALPVHQQITLHGVRWMGSCVREIAATNTRRAERAVAVLQEGVW
jgi:dTDP-4-amino-4,6-dideoxygalactose transaminase